jgi:hypothetical protein
MLAASLMLLRGYRKWTDLLVAAVLGMSAAILLGLMWA